MNYNEVMKVVEDMMSRTGIGEFCRTVCKGNCCGPCEARSCLDGKRKLACSAFICEELDNIINRLKYGYRYTTAIRKVQEHLIKKLHKTYRKMHGEPYYETISSIYFGELPGETELAKIRFNSVIINKLNEIDLPRDWKQGIELRDGRPYKASW